MSQRATISRDELHARMAGGESLNLFEVLPEQYFRRHHLPGATHLPPTAIERTVARLVPRKDAEIIVYCWDEH